MTFRDVILSPVFWIVAAIALAGGSFWLGTSYGSAWADSEYLQEREERTKKLAVLEQENDVLRKANEAKAEILKSTDTANDLKRVEEFNRLQEERDERNKQIDNTAPGDQLCGLCADAARSGFPLSNDSCGRCGPTPQVGR